MTSNQLKITIILIRSLQTFRYIGFFKLSKDYVCLCVCIFVYVFVCVCVSVSVCFVFLCLMLILGPMMVSV